MPLCSEVVLEGPGVCDLECKVFLSLFSWQKGENKNWRIFEGMSGYLDITITE